MIRFSVVFQRCVEVGRYPVAVSLLKFFSRKTGGRTKYILIYVRLDKILIFYNKPGITIGRARGSRL